MLFRCALLAVCVLALVCFAQPTTAAAACGYEGLDFSPLVGTDLSGSDGTANYKYFLSLCGPLTSSAASSCVQVQSESSACQIGGSHTFDVGNWDAASPPTWSYVDPSTKKAVQYSITGANQCWQGSYQAYTTTVVLQCAEAQGALTVVPPTGSSCNLIFTLPTPHACPGGASGGASAKKGLSGGWIFIIILCVVLPLYVLVGCIYKSQKLGATGMDKCPNVEFWRDLPSLVKEGCAFTVNKLRGLCGGGASSGSNTYETM